MTGDGVWHKTISIKYNFSEFVAFLNPYFLEKALVILYCKLLSKLLDIDGDLNRFAIIYNSLNPPIGKNDYISIDFGWTSETRNTKK